MGLLGKLRRQGRHGGGVAADACLGVGALAGVDGRLEQAVEQGAVRPPGPRQLRGPRYLPEDLGLANDRRIQPCCNPHQVLDGLCIGIAIEVRADLPGLHAARLAQQSLQLVEGEAPGGRIQFDAVAGGEDHQVRHVRGCRL